MNFRLPLLIAAGTSLAYLSTPTIALAQAADDFNPTHLKKNNSPESLTTGASPLTESTATHFISDGQVVRIKGLTTEITPPVGWEVVTDMPGLSLVIQEPKKSGPADYTKPTFQRNITVSVSHEPSPIDEKEAQLIKERLLAELSKNTNIKNLQVMEEHRFFNHKATNDGLVIYSSFTNADIPMMQMHLIVSGSEQRVLLSYTDLQSEFESNKAAFEAAWSAMTSIKVTGEAPKRYTKLIQNSVAGATLGLCLLGLLISRRIRAKRSLENAERETEDADLLGSADYSDISGISGTSPLTQSGVWNLADVMADEAAQDLSDLEGPILNRGLSAF